MRSKSKPSNQASAGSSPTNCKYLIGYNLIPSREGNGKPPPRKISPGKNYNEEYTLHCNRRRSESSKALDEEEYISQNKKRIYDELHTARAYPDFFLNSVLIAQ